MRPYKNSSIEELEKLVGEFDDDYEVLIQVRDELLLRDTSRSRVLLEKVKGTIAWFDEQIARAIEVSRPKQAAHGAAAARDPQTAAKERAAQVKIAELRQRLLDLSSRNRLISFKHSARGSRFIRLVDEWLPSLHEVLEEDKPIELLPLPPFPSTPDDELRPEFVSALEEAMLTDKAYLNVAAAAEEEPEEKSEALLAKAERALRDRLRKKLGLPSRADALSLSVAEHARRCGIDPAVDLKNPAPLRKRRKKTQWQTLISAEDLERRMRALEQQARESREEYGVETLYLVLGFLEWPEKTPAGEAEDKLLSPLLLVSLKIEKLQADRRSRGVEGMLLIEDGEDRPNKARDVYVIQGGNEEVTVNLCLRERLRQDYGVILPDWDEELGAEVYLRSVESAIAGRDGWKVRNYATITHLTFNRLAMWIDLDPENRAGSPHTHPVLGDLFGGGGGGAAAEAAKEEEIVHSEVGVPSLVLDCDSSQFAAIKSALAGKNLTIQGPPGTGKSQTIANLIASLLYQGKTVLFVAEKMAALDVVHSRLTEAGIGDFLLELHSAKAAKKDVLGSIRRRLGLRSAGSSVAEATETRRKNLKEKLDSYALAINSTFGASGRTVHEIIWENFDYRDKRVPTRLSGYRLAGVADWDSDAFDTRAKRLEEYFELLDRYAGERAGADAHPWAWVENPNLHVEESARLYRHVLDLRSSISELKDWLEEKAVFHLPISYATLRLNSEAVRALGVRPQERAAGLWVFALRSDAAQVIEFVQDAYRRRVAAEQTISSLAPGLLRGSEKEVKALRDLQTIAQTVMPGSADTTTYEQLAHRNAEVDRLLSELDRAVTLMAQLRNVLPWTERVGDSELRSAAQFIRLVATAPEAILAQRHHLGDEGQTSIVRSALEAMDECEAKCGHLNSRLKVRLESLDHAVLTKHRDELTKGGFFAFLRSDYREARRFCENVCPGVPQADRLSFISELCDTVGQRGRLGADQVLRDVAGSLFTGWESHRPNIRGCCDWVDKVRAQTPIIERHSSLLRQVLFAVNHDHRQLAQQLEQAGWPELFDSFASLCERDGVALDEVRLSLVRRQQDMKFMMELMTTLGWNGPVGHGQLQQASNALHVRHEATEELASHPGVLDLLLPDPAAAAESVRAIADAIQRVRALPVSTVWRERLQDPESSGAWEEFSAVGTELAARLASVERSVFAINAMSNSQFEFQHRCDRATLEDWLRILEKSSGNEKMLATRARLLIARANLERMDLLEFVAGATGPEMKQFAGIRDLFRAVYLQSCAGQAIESQEALREFKQASPQAIREKFRKMDADLKELHRYELVTKLQDEWVPEGVSVGLIKERTELGLLTHVAYLEKPRTTVRDLLRRAGRALQALKPCFMMSPLSVAQLIERGKLTFDVVIFDEASQIRPEDALSAMSRSRQFVVVGDQMQLPPTSFGEKTHDTALEEEEGEEVEESAAVESILHLASTTYGNGRMLLWHYRSRDPSLIAYSNREFYKRELQLFPCPHAKSNGTGVKYVWIGGKYSARTNVEEAKACARAAIEFMKDSPDRSLGIVALNRPQADLIQLELDRLMHEHGHAANYEAKWRDGLEPLFVKNLENVQGDERDTIFISTVFGDDEEGNFYQRFGPINSAVGHRRLNVLFTRAKYQLVLFTSLPTEKIQLTGSSHWGVRALKEYLDFARSGRLEGGKITGKSEDSPFEVSVRRALEAAGYQCEPQVGVSGFFIDLAVRHPQYPDHFMAGIECDGASYHSSRSARDRDRLRQDILHNLGWQIHRIWSTDWFADPHGRLQQLLEWLDSLKKQQNKSMARHRLDFAARFSKPRGSPTQPSVEGDAQELVQRP